MAMCSYRLYNAEFLRSKGLIVTELEEEHLAIVRYHKSNNEWKNQQFGKCDREDEVVRNHRSVVYDMETGHVIAVAPIRRLSDDTVVIDNLSKDDWSLSNYYDGTMISVFWSERLQLWFLSTRSRIHAMCKFTSERLFRDLFMDALDGTLEELCETLNPRLCYTYILQHPESRHILPVSSPTITLVNVVECTPNENATECTLHNLYSEGNGNVPKQTLFETTEAFHEECRRCIRGEGAYENSLQGLVLVNGWNRIRLITPSYEQCLQVRGDGPSLRTNYIRLMITDPTGAMLHQYSDWYPEEKEDIQRTIQTMNVIVGQMVELYKKRHVSKTMVHEDLPHWCRRPLWDLHGNYLRTRVPIRREEVMTYFATRPASFIHRMVKAFEKGTS